MTSTERARAIVDSYREVMRSELPEGTVLYDAHTHLGNDIDGMVANYDELIGLLDRYGFSQANVFCMDEHDREPAFTVANDRTLAYAEKAAGRLVPYVRLDLTTRPLEEARRCLDLGAQGIKLHPRAQAFSLDDERLAPIFELATERDVPILIHGGRGLPPIAEHLETLVHRCDGVRLIVAHAGIADMAGPRGTAGRHSRRLLRHLRLERRRPARSLPPGVAGADRLRLGLPVRPPAELGAHDRPHRPSRRLRRLAAARACWARTRSASQSARRCRT